MSARYNILGPIASGGMASVYLGRKMGSAGFSRPVAIKRLHPHLASERDFITMLVDEARLAAQIRHANVVDTLDLVVSDGAFSLVLEYVEGESLSALIAEAAKCKETVPRSVALAILYGVLRGLEAAHEARDAEDQPLGIVHRDISPQNILVGIDGVPRIIDFGVAKALGRMFTTRPGEVRGKFAYMAPEQLLGRPVTRQVDVYAAGVLLWELLVGRRLFTGEDERVVCAAVMRGAIRPPSEVNPDVPRELDAVVMRATAHALSERYLTARELLAALEPWETASDDEVGAWVRRLSAVNLAKRHRLLQEAVSVSDRRVIDELLHDLAQSNRPSSAPPPSTGPVVASAAAPPAAEVPESGGHELIAPRPRRRILFAALAALAALAVLALASTGLRRPTTPIRTTAANITVATTAAADIPVVRDVDSADERMADETNVTPALVGTASASSTPQRHRAPPRPMAADPRSYR